MRRRLVECKNCQLVYAADKIDTSVLSEAYAESAFESKTEETYASRTYAELIQTLVDRFAVGRALALEIGSGSGTFLEQLKQMGFKRFVGIEPSRSSIEHSADSVRSSIIHGMFSQTSVEGLSPDLVCSFMTLEHVEDPLTLAKTSRSILRPGGVFAVVVHNRSAWLNRILGPKSPIIDVEHLQLFNKSSAMALFQQAGFSEVQALPMTNRYPLSYWFKLCPLPVGLKQKLSKLMVQFKIDALPISLNVGNILVFGRK